MAILMGFSSITWAQSEDSQRDPSTIKIVPVTPPAGRSVGDDCSNPIVVTLPADFPYVDLNDYTCGCGNNYANTGCLGSYDGGEDIMYELNVTSPVTVSISMDPKGTSYSGIALLSSCGDAPCIAYQTFVLDLSDNPQIEFSWF